MLTFKTELSTMFTEDVRAAWLKLFSYIYKQMLYGYHNWTPQLEYDPGLE